MPKPASMFPVPMDAASAGVSQVQWLAGLAMQSFISRMESLPDTEAEREEVALWSYRMAQAMKKMETRINIEQAEATD